LTSLARKLDGSTVVNVELKHGPEYIERIECRLAIRYITYYSPLYVITLPVFMTSCLFTF